MSASTAPQDPVTVAGTEAPLLVVERLSKEFGAVKALQDVSFSVNAGEVVGLVGDNGAGKSTLVTIVAGVQHPTSGHVFLDGKPLDVATPAEARDAGIETVYQELALIEMFDMATNFFLGREILQKGIRQRLGVLNRRDMRRRAREKVSEIPAKFPNFDAAVETMSGGQRQIVALAKAAFWGGRLLLAGRADGRSRRAGIRRRAGHDQRAGRGGPGDDRHRPQSPTRLVGVHPDPGAEAGLPGRRLGQGRNHGRGGRGLHNRRSVSGPRQPAVTAVNRQETCERFAGPTVPTID